ncbi:MAG TPA: hypothetical protein VHF51_04510 [Solirubrobacteraceae bacterium]|nr:hypothetical protein [Solirubrobacteraceae bacterium]
MLTRIRRRLPGSGNGPWIVIAAGAAAMIITPFAVAAGEGRPIDGGARNPSSNETLSYNRETEIIANTATYGTRQSNKSSSGGGAIYGCRARSGTRSCVRASNLSNGRAFSFASNSGGEVGRIDGPTTAAPFTTSATGLATGLNADRVDNKSANELTTDAVAAANRFAVVSAAGTLGANRGATAAANPAGAGTYTVTFGDNISNCALAATLAQTAGGEIGVTLAADNRTVNVTTRDSNGNAADHPFHLTVTC